MCQCGEESSSIKQVLYGGHGMKIKRRVAAALLAAGGILCLILLPVEVWLALVGITMIALAVIFIRSC